MPLSDAELKRLLKDPDSDRVERKDLNERGDFGTDRICQAICAFSNDLPGYQKPGVIFLGVRDDGTPSGRTIDDQLLLKLGHLRDRGDILPLPHMTVRKLPVEGSDVAVVEVAPGRTPPVRYKGVTWIRVRPRRARSSHDEERQLNERRRAWDLPFDAQPVHGATLDDLDLLLFRRVYLPAAVAPEVLAENHRTVVEQLALLRLADTSETPTVAGLLVLGKEPTSFIPGAYVQFLRLDDDSLADPVLNEKRLDGSLIDILRQLDELIGLNISTHIDLGRSTEDRRPDYPDMALQQLIRNALHHRSYEATNSPVRITWYTDRVEIVSPGGPFGLVTPENFRHRGVTDYRNPTLSDALRALGYIQCFGVGLEIARRALNHNGNPPPEFEATQQYVAVTVRSAP